MKLTLTTNDGLLIDQWDIENDFGDLNYSLSRARLCEEIAAQYYRGKGIEKERERQARLQAADDAIDTRTSALTAGERNK